MIERVPPKVASWFLEHWGSPYHGDSLAGDLIEQYQEGRSRAWYWKQVGAAILVARWRRIRSAPWTVTGRALSHLLAETAAVLAVVVTVDQARRTHSLGAMLNVNFVGVLIALITVASIGFLVSMRPGRRRQRHAAINALLLVFGVIALGAGTLTWADTLRGDARQDCSCPSQQGIQ